MSDRGANAGVPTGSVALTVANYRKAYAAMATSERLMLPSERLRELRQIQSQRNAERDAKKSWYDHSRKVLKAQQTHSLSVAGLPATVDHRDADIARQTAFNERDHVENAARRQEKLIASSHCTTERDIFPHRGFRPAEQFNFRNLDTHSRIWPTYKPKWNAERAGELRAYEIRGRPYNFINHCSNVIPGIPQ